MSDGICFVGLDVHARKTAAAAVQLGSGEVFKAQLSGSLELPRFDGQGLIGSIRR